MTVARCRALKHEPTHDCTERDPRRHDALYVVLRPAAGPTARHNLHVAFGSEERAFGLVHVLTYGRATAHPQRLCCHTFGMPATAQPPGRTIRFLSGLSPTCRQLEEDVGLAESFTRRHFFERSLVHNLDRAAAEPHQTAGLKLVERESDCLTVGGDHIGQLLVTGVDRRI